MNNEFEKLHNFRDLGGLIGADGRKVRAHRLLRSGNLAHLTENDVQLLANVYQLRHVVDLRTKSEIETEPDVPVPGADYCSLDFFPVNEANKATGSADQLQAMRRKEETQQMMRGLYASFITDQGVREKIKEILQLLLDTPEGATLWHCFAGKDRAGITAAVILTILGVSKDDVMADYEATNQSRKQANEEILNQLKAQGMDDEMLEAVEAALCVDPAYMEICYQTAEEKFGSFENYIIDGIGFSQESWQALRDLYLA